MLQSLVLDQNFSSEFCNVFQ